MTVQSFLKTLRFLQIVLLPRSEAPASECSPEAPASTIK